MKIIEEGWMSEPLQRCDFTGHHWQCNTCGMVILHEEADPIMPGWDGRSILLECPGCRGFIQDFFKVKKNMFGKWVTIS